MSGFARAQTYPSRPITMIVPFAPGGLTDVIGRVLAEGMRTSLGQSVIIENVGGANGSIGAGRVARAAPDGSALVVGSLRCSAVRRPRGRLPRGRSGSRRSIASAFSPMSRNRHSTACATGCPSSATSRVRL